MGDVLHGLPAAAGLRQALPGCTIGWAVEPRWKPLLFPLQSGAHKAGPPADRAHLVNAREWQGRPFEFATGGEIAALRRELRDADYDVCVDLQGSIKSAVVGRMARAKRFVGPDHPREQAARWLYRERVAVSREHVIEQACELVSAAVSPAVPAIKAAPVQVPVDEDAEGWCTAALARAGIAERFVLLAPGAGWGAKQWGAERYARLAARLRDEGFGIVVNAPAAGPDADLAETVAKAGNGQRVSSTVAQLIALTRRADLVIGGDTGPVHLAAALGRPTVALFGPTDPRRNGPAFPGARVTTLRHPASVTGHKRTRETEAGLARITVDEAHDAAFALLGAWHG